MKRVLVTGSNGQLGMTIRDLTPKYPDLEFSFTDKSDLDITRTEQVIQFFRELKPDYCINCAAFTRVDEAEKTPDRAYDVNVKGVENLVGACKTHEVILIHLSTDYVFDGTKEEGYTPDDQPNPINVYGRSKWEGEQIIQKVLERYFIVRTSWLYSKTYGHNFYKTILSKARKGETITVTDQQRGCPTDARHLAKYLLTLIVSGNTRYGIKHFTDGEAMSWYELAEKILIIEGLRANTTLKRGENYRTFAMRPKNSFLLEKNTDLE